MTDRDMTLVEHLAELRSRLIKTFAGFIAATALTWVFHEQIFRFLALPVMRGLVPHGVTSLQALDVMEGISVYLKASMAAAFVISSPWILWQVAAFVAPALRRREKRLFVLGTALVSLFFILGVMFSYSIFIPLVVEFLAGFGTGSGSMYLAPTIQKTFGMSMFFMIVFGFIFELPLVMMFAGMLHLVTPRTFLKHSRHFIVIAFIAAAIFTPPEPVSQTLMAIPLCLLYGLGTVMAWAGWHGAGKNARGRRIATTATAIVLFTAGTAGAAIYWNGRSIEPAAEKAAGSRSTVIEMDGACVAGVSGWKIPADGHVTVNFGPDGSSGVRFAASGTYALPLPEKTGNRPVDRFIYENRDRTWTAVHDEKATIMVAVDRREAEAFLAELVAATGRYCR